MFSTFLGVNVLRNYLQVGTCEGTIISRGAGSDPKFKCGPNVPVGRGTGRSPQASPSRYSSF